MHKIICKLFVGIFILLLCIGTTSVYAKNKVTETLDLTSKETEDKLTEEGWAWDNNTKTLTLDGITIEITDQDGEANDCIKFNRNENITIIFKGENNLIADKGYSLYGVFAAGDGTLTLKGEEDAVLNLSYKTLKSTYRGNNGTTIGYPNNLVIESGTINCKGTVMVDDTFTMKGGTFNLESWDTSSDDSGIYAIQQVNITGGNLKVALNGTAIMVPGTLKETDKADGVIISGGNVVLDSKEGQGIYAGRSDATPEGNYTKNVIINGGNITISSEYGIYVRKGHIIINNVESADVSNVREDVLKVYGMEGNYITCPEADYSKVDEAIKKANTLNKADYKDFSAVDEAISLVERDKNLLYQSEVDAMAFNINNAIANLVLKKEPKPQEPDKADIPNEDIDNTENPDTYDGILKYIIYLVLSTVGFGYGIFLYKKESINY